MSQDFAEELGYISKSLTTAEEQVAHISLIMASEYFTQEKRDEFRQTWGQYKDAATAIKNGDYSDMGFRAFKMANTEFVRCFKMELAPKEGAPDAMIIEFDKVLHQLTGSCTCVAGYIDCIAQEERIARRESSRSL